MAALTDYLENALVNEVLRGIDYVPPTAVHVALFTSATSDAGAGTEVTGGGYARQPITFTAPTDGVSANSADISFTNMPAGTVTHIAIMDAATAGNMLFHGPLAAGKTVNTGDTLTIAAGDLTASLS